MKYSEIKSLAEGVAPVVRDLLDKATAPLVADNKALTDRLAALERRLDSLPAPKDGEDAGPEAVAALVHDRIKSQLDAMQRAVDGIPEAPELPDIPAMIEASIAAAVSELPKPQDGKDADEEQIASDVEGRVKAYLDEQIAGIAASQPGIELPDFAAMIAADVEKAVASLPRPADGKSVTAEDVLPALKEHLAELVKAIPQAKDGVGLAGALIDRDGALVITLSNGEAKDLGSVVGRNGDDGEDGLGFEDLTFEASETGRMVAKFQRGDVVKTVKLPGIIDRGIFREGETYEKGDAVSWGGSLWIAQEDGVTDKPEATKAWRLAVKKGRDARDTEAKKVL